MSSAETSAPTGISIRRATWNDAISFWYWRNDTLSRAMSRNSDPIALKNHLAWFKNAIRDPNRIFLIAETNLGAENEKLGGIRFDRHDDGQWEVAYTVAPEKRGAGVGTAMLKAGMEYLFNSPGYQAEEKHGSSRLFAEIKPGNPASLKACRTVRI